VSQWAEREDIGIEVDERREERVQAKEVELCEGVVEIRPACL